MSQSSIKEFGQLLVQIVRDSAIRNCDQNTNSNGRSPIARRWREAMNSPNVVIPDCVDETLSCLLEAIDQGSIQLSFRKRSGELINLNSEGLGELSGEYMASGGWRSEFSKQRVNNDFADLA